MSFRSSMDFGLVFFVLELGFFNYDLRFVEIDVGYCPWTVPLDLLSDFQESWYCNVSGHGSTGRTLVFFIESFYPEGMINRYLLDTRNNIEPLYPSEFIEQYGSNAKRFIDDMLTVAPGLPSWKGLTFELIIKREGWEGGVYGGMYPEHILDDEGAQVANPVSINKEQRGQTVHFLDMEILQSTSGVSQIRMYDTRDHMIALRQ